MLKELIKALLRSCATYFRTEKKCISPHAITHSVQIIRIFCSKKAIPSKFRLLSEFLPRFDIKNAGAIVQILHTFIAKTNPQLALFTTIQKANLEGYSRELRVILLSEIIPLKDVYHQLIDIFELKPQQIE